MWQSCTDGKRSKSQRSGVGVRGWVEIELPFRTTGFAMTKWGLKFIMIRDEKMWKWESASRSVVSDSLWRHRTYPTRLLCPWHSPGKNTGVDCHPLLQRIFLTQGLNPGLLHCRQILYCLSYRKVSYRKEREVCIITADLHCCMAEMKVKEESEKVGLNLNIQKTKIMSSGPITSWQIDGETVETVRLHFLGGLQNHCRWWLQPWN